MQRNSNALYAMNNLSISSDIVSDTREKKIVCVTAAVGVVASVFSAGLLAPPALIATFGLYGSHKWKQHKRQQKREAEQKNGFKMS